MKVTFAKRARELTRRKGGLEITNYWGKLTDCSSKDATISEMFIVEGDSAAGSAKMGRDPITQAILPIRGKILNVEKARLDRILANEEISGSLDELRERYARQAEGTTLDDMVVSMYKEFQI